MDSPGLRLVMMNKSFSLHLSQLTVEVLPEIVLVESHGTAHARLDFHEEEHALPYLVFGLRLTDREIDGGLTAYSTALARFVLPNLHNFILDRYDQDAQVRKPSKLLTFSNRSSSDLSHAQK